MNVLGVFAKHWAPGAVKTRLAAKIGEDWACHLYRRFVQRMLDRFSQIGDRRFVVYWPPEARKAIADAAGDEWELQPQVSGDLGTRMRRFFEAALSDGGNRVVL